MMRTGWLLVQVGTKAQFIKTAPLLLELARRGLDYRLVYTGQHSETFSALEAAFDVPTADDNLVPSNEADSASRLVVWVFRFWGAAISRILRGEWRGAGLGVVHGDTLSTLLSALAMRLAGIPVAHVEAGLRSPRLLSPFPEEIVRRLVSRLSALHLAPDALAACNLRGVSGLVVDTGGNTLADSLRCALATIELADRVCGRGGYAIASMHRSENLRNRQVLDFLMDTVVETSRRLPVRFVLHPVTRKRLMATGWLARLEAEPGVEIVPRVDYIEFVRLMLGAKFLMTDGGSNQEEAAMLGLPTVLLRRETERPDGLGDDGCVVLSGLNRRLISDFVGRNAGREWQLRSTPFGLSPSAKIADAIAEFLERR